MADNQATGKGSPTMGACLTGMIFGIALFALAYHFGALNSFIATWSPSNHQHAQLEWN